MILIWKGRLRKMGDQLLSAERDQSHISKVEDQQ